MTLILYIIIFTAVCFWRKRTLSGAHLKEKLHGDGREYLEALLRSNKGQSVSVTLGLELASAQNFSIRREKSYHRLLKSLGLAEEISVGDETVDSTLFFVTETPEGFRDIIARKSALESIKKLFTDYKITELRCFNSRIWITCPTISIAAYDASYAAERLEALGTLANAAEAASTDMLPAAGFFTKPRIAGFFMIIHAALFTLGILGGLPLFIESMEIVKISELVYTGGIMAALLVVFWMYCIIITLGRTSWIPMVAADFVLMGVAGFFLSTFFTAREINMHFDTSPAKEYVRKVVYKDCKLTCTRGSGKRRQSSTYHLSDSQCTADARANTLADYTMRDSKCSWSSSFSFELHIEPWLQGQTTNFDYSVSDVLYDTTARGTKMSVPSHKGALGIDWVDADAIRPVK